MDTQIKLVIEIENFNAFYPSSQEIIPIDINNFDEKYLSEHIFEIKEYDNAKLYFISNDDDITLKIECYYNGITCENNTDEDYDIDDIMCVVKNGESIQLSPGGDADDMLVPGTYSLQLCKGNRCFESSYRIIPNSMKWYALNEIKDSLENTVKGLSQNIYLHKKSIKQGYINFNKNIEKYLYLLEIQEQLLNNIKLIIRNPILDIKKEYVSRDYSKKQDSKSQRWLSKKGMKYISNISSINRYHEKHSFSTNNTIENVILKRIIMYIQNILTKAESEYAMIINSITSQIDDIKFNINYKNKSYIKAASLPNTNETNKMRKTQLNVLHNDLELCKEKQMKINQNINNIKSLKSKINFYLNETWLKEIEVKYNNKEFTTRILKNHPYNEIFRIYNKLKNSNLEGGLDVSFTHKKTSKLFEIYCFLITKDIFEELGFSWVDGWLKSRDIDELYSGDILSGDSIIMEKGEYKLIISYDKYIGIPEELKDIKTSQPSTKPDNQHRRPDILVSLYKGNKLLGCEVIEVKYRKKANIYNNKGIDTDVCKQLSSYTGFDYYDALKGRVIREKPVYKVLTIYPKQDDLGQFKHNIYDIEFIPIMPIKDNNKKFEGYENMKNEIIEFLNEFTDN